MASIVENEEFDAESAAQKLRDSMEGIGTDEYGVSSVLGTHCNWQLLEIKTQYTAMFGRDLVEDLQGETKGYFEELCVALVRERTEFLAYLVNEALSGAGTTDQIIIDIFGVISPGEVQSLKEVYETTFEKKMEEDITSDLGGYFERFLIAIMSGGRSEDEGDPDVAFEDAEKLYEAGEGTFGTDECAFMSVFMTRSWDQLALTMEAYDGLLAEKGEEDKTLLSTIQSEFTGCEEQLLTTIVKYAASPRDYFVQVLRDCMEGIGTKDRRLFYNIVRRSEIDLADIRDGYNEQFEEDLAERIQNEVSSDFGDLLRYLVNGNQ
jgi:hypothetical protein